MKNISKVVIAQDASVFQGHTIRQDVVNRMLTAGITKLVGTSAPIAAWKSVFRPTDVVGLKINCLAGRGLSTHREVVEAIVAGLNTAGIADEQILVWDKANRDLKRAGFVINTGRRGVKCFGTDALRQGYETTPSSAGQIGSLFSTLLSTHCSATINAPILKDHDLAGVSIGMKNFYGAIHNPNKYHLNNCNPYIADLNTHPYIRERVRLTICDALVPQYHGGPGFKPRFTWQYGAILLSFDPVALDAVGADILAQKRQERGMKSFREVGRYPEYIHTAASYGLGEDDLSKIEIVYCAT